MYGNGVAIGMEVTAVRLKPILPVLQVALTVCYAAAVGAAMQGTVACRIATTARLAEPTAA